MSTCAITPYALTVYYAAPQQLAFDCLHTLMLPATPADAAGYPALFGMTLLVELPLYVAMLLALRAATLRGAAAIAVVVNLATHPFVSFLLPSLLAAAGQTRFAPYLAAAEIFAPVVEGLLVWRWTRLPFALAMAVGIACNLASWTLGALVLA